MQDVDPAVHIEIRRRRVKLALIALSYASIVLTLYGLGARGMHYWFLFFSPMMMAGAFFGLRGATVASAGTFLALVGLYELADVGSFTLALSREAIGSLADLLSSPADAYQQAVLGSTMLATGSLAMGYATDRRWFDETIVRASGASSAVSSISKQRVRELLDLMVANALHNDSPGAVLLVHLVGFQHLGGTVVEQQTHSDITNSLRALLRGNDLVARTTDGDLVVVLANAGREQAEAAAQQVLATLRQRKVLNRGQHEAINASIGITFYPEEGRNADRVLAHAAEALQQATEWTENGIYYYRQKFEKPKLLIT